MICPECKCEYIRGVTQCSDCGVPLVDKLEPEQTRFEDARLVPVWSGTDANDREQVGNALEDAGIPHTFADTKSVFFQASKETLEVWVADADRERANQVVMALDDRLHPDEGVVEESDAASALPESDEPQADEDDAGVESDLDQEWDEDEPANEVWSGDAENLADTLAICLREIGIASRNSNEGGRWSVAVRPPQEKRAREIVREVVDASPPE